MFWGSMSRLLFVFGFLVVLHTAQSGNGIDIDLLECTTTTECRTYDPLLYCENRRCRCPMGYYYDRTYGCIEGCNPYGGEAECNYRGVCRMRSNGRYECDCDRGYDGRNCYDTTTTMTTTTRRRGGAIAAVAAAAGIPLVVLAAAAALGASYLGK